MNYESIESYSDSEAGLAFLVIYGLIMIGALVFNYLLRIYPSYYMFKTAGLRNPWIAFIPLVNEFKMFNLIGCSQAWYLLTLLGCIPVVGYIALIAINWVLCWNIAKRFGLGTAGKVLAMFLGIFIFWYIALTKKQYNGYGNRYSALSYQPTYDQNGQAWYNQDNANTQYNPTYDNSNYHNQNNPNTDKQPQNNNQQNWW